jgi:predicted GNAT family acetyltransferase
MKIKHKEYGSNGIFKAYDEDGRGAGEMTYVWAGEEKIIIDHTGVRTEYEGQGIGKQLVMSAVEFARERGIKIMPLCPFAKAMFVRIPEINDVKF